MLTIASSLRVFAFASVLAVQALPSQAQAPNTFVRGAGDDGLTCTDFATACRTVAAAIDPTKLQENGVVQVIDAGDQSAFAVNHSLTILGSVHNNVIVASAVGAGGTPSGILVRPPSANDIVSIIGFGIDQQRLSYHGLHFTSLGTLHLQDCFIRASGTAFGVAFVPTGPGELHISDCTISDNGLGGSGGGILIRPTGSGSANVVLENVRIENNRLGLLVDSTLTTGTVNVTIRNSTISGSSILGVLANGSKAVLRMGNSTVAANPTGLGVANGGQIVSQGGNVVSGNSVNGTFTSTVAQQ